MGRVLRWFTPEDREKYGLLNVDRYAKPFLTASPDNVPQVCVHCGPTEVHFGISYLDGVTRFGGYCNQCVRLCVRIYK